MNFVDQFDTSRSDTFTVKGKNDNENENIKVDQTFKDKTNLELLKLFTYGYVSNQVKLLGYDANETPGVTPLIYNVIEKICNLFANNDAKRGTNTGFIWGIYKSIKDIIMLKDGQSNPLYSPTGTTYSEKYNNYV